MVAFGYPAGPAAFGPNVLRLELQPDVCEGFGVLLHRACPFAISAENDILMASARALTAPRNLTAWGDVAGSVEASSQQVDRLQTFNSNM